MCNSLEEAQAHCKVLYGHENVATGDFMDDDGHYYRGREDLYWAVEPDMGTGDPGVLAIRPGAKPICQHHAGNVVNITNRVSA